MNFINPSELTGSDDIAVGTWTCRCGAVTFGPLYATVTTTLYPQCPNCHEVGELLTLPFPTGGEGDVSRPGGRDA